jgi:hypothetical protein
MPTINACSKLKEEEKRDAARCVLNRAAVDLELHKRSVSR